MTNEEVLKKLDKKEAIFRVLTQVRGGCKLYCMKCDYWNEHEEYGWGCDAPDEEVECRKAFNQWLAQEAE